MNEPKRIQRKRTKGWRMPAGTVSVTRPGRFGNPYAVKAVDRHGQYPFGWRVVGDPSLIMSGLYSTDRAATERAVHLFRREAERPSWVERLAELRGKDLACWCPLEDADGRPWPCHASVLLELANREPIAHGLSDPTGVTDCCRRAPADIPAGDLLRIVGRAGYVTCRGRV